jgi:hypothetical protein
MKLLACVLLLAAALFAFDTDVTGTWTGSFDMVAPNGETKGTGALLILKQEGTNITGTVGPDENERFPIQTGKIEGDKISLEVTHGEGVIKFALVLANGHITGEANLSHNGETSKAKIDVTRQK